MFCDFKSYDSTVCDGLQQTRSEVLCLWCCKEFLDCRVHSVEVRCRCFKAHSTTFCQRVIKLPVQRLYANRRRPYANLSKQMCSQKPWKRCAHVAPCGDVTTFSRAVQWTSRPTKNFLLATKRVLSRVYATQTYMHWRILCADCPNTLKSTSERSDASTLRSEGKVYMSVN